MSKSLEMRNVHPSTNGWLDPSNTTDHGPNVGLIKSLNVGIRITLGIERLVRPVMVVEKGSIVCQEYYNDIMNDKEVLNDFYLFMQKYPHVVEFIDVEQRRMAGARVTLGDAQQKHTLSGMSRDNFNKFDNTLNLSLPFEIPCITNDTLQLSNLIHRGFGVHLMVAVMSWKAMNLEDSIILSSSCYKSGKLSVISTTKYRSEVPVLGLNSPLPSRLIHSHKKLEATGLPRIGTILEKDDAMHKHIDCRFKSAENFNIKSNISFDVSDGLSTNYPVRVERIRKEGNSNIVIKYLLSSFRYKEIGDKMTNQAAQKGTIGCIIDNDMLPHTINGVTPDIIINSVSIISRKTFNFYNQIKLTSSYSSNPFGDNEGSIKLINYQPLTNTGLDSYHSQIINRYKRYNDNLTDEEYDEKASCLVDLYNPYTHELIKCDGGNKHFMGMEYYLLLTQMAIEKITVRNRGKKTKLLQAPSGKKRQGGIRFGEMEGDGIACHGASDVLLSLLSDSVEDRIESFICTRCGDFATHESNPDYSRWKCTRCENLGYSPELNKFNFTYAF
ncbi:uncharacterized protein [Linepithema humile]|uniref:uncharacterized protein n=1 Tax=Linepithema humile TaxID=83485 RepID=UPI00351E5E6C